MFSFVEDVITPKNLKISKTKRVNAWIHKKKQSNFFIYIGDNVDCVGIQMSTLIEGIALHLVHALMMWLNHELIT